MFASSMASPVPGFGLLFRKWEQPPNAKGKARRKSAPNWARREGAKRICVIERLIAGLFGNSTAALSGNIHKAALDLPAIGA
jgi:hypothetical protein